MNPNERKQTATVAGAVALILSAMVLGLLWRYGIWKIKVLGNTDVRVVVWTSSIMITAGWCTTAAGIMTTISSIVINCLLYISVALLLRRCWRWGSGFRPD